MLFSFSQTIFTSSITPDLSVYGESTSYLGAYKTDYYILIPTVSFMGLKFSNNQINWFYTPTSLISNTDVDDITPFDAWFMPD